MNHNNMNHVRQKPGNDKHFPFWVKVLEYHFLKRTNDPKRLQEELYRLRVGESDFVSSWEVGSDQQIADQTTLKMEVRPNVCPDYEMKEKDAEKLYQSLLIFWKEYKEGKFGPIVLITEDADISIHGNKTRWTTPGFTVPKGPGKDGKERWRQIRDFSAVYTNNNPEGNCVNSFCDADDARMSTASQADVGTMCIQHGASGKVDMTNAFRERGLAPMCVAGQFYALISIMWLATGWDWANLASCRERATRCFYGVWDDKFVMGRSPSPNYFSTLLNLLVTYLQYLKPWKWQLNRKGHKKLAVLGLKRQNIKNIFYPIKRKIKYHKSGPKVDTPVIASRPWNDTAGTNFAAFISRCNAPITMILMDDGVTGDNNEGIEKGNVTLNELITIMDKDGGFVINHGKTVLMCVINEDGFQGWGMHHGLKLLFIRQSTVDKYILDMTKMKQSKKATLSDLESLIGKYNWLSTIILQARLLAPMIMWLLNEHKVTDDVGKLKNGRKTVPLDAAILHDLDLGLFLIKNRNTKPAIYCVFNWRIWELALDGTSDAAKRHGFGWICHQSGDWCAVPFFENEWAMDLDQNQSEALGCLSIINHLAPLAQKEGKIIRLENDNRAVIAAATKCGSFKPSLYAFSRAIIWAEAKWNVRVYLQFVDGENNIADAPSRTDKPHWLQMFKESCLMHKSIKNGRKQPIYPGKRCYPSLERLSASIE